MCCSSAMAEDPEDRPTAAQFRDQLTALNLSTKLAPRPLEITQEITSLTSSPASGPSPQGGAGRRQGGAAASQDAGEMGAARSGDRGDRALVIAVASVIAVVNLATRTPAAEPTPAVTTSAAASPTFTPVVVPAGFIDCSERLGQNTYCASRPECWAGVTGLSDVPSWRPLMTATRSHMYQTFIAGRLTYDVRRQSQLDSDAHIRRVCTNEIANSMLRSRDRRSDWEIRYLGPQQPNEYYFRCIIGRGERSEPFEPSCS